MKRSQAPEGMLPLLTYFGFSVLAVSHIRNVFVFLCVVFLKGFSIKVPKTLSMSFQRGGPSGITADFSSGDV